MPAFVVKHCSNGRILGFILRNLPFAKGVVPLALTVICRLIFLRDINRMGASLAYSLILLNVLTLYLIQLFGLPLNSMVVILPLSTCCLICTIIFRVVFGMQDALAPFWYATNGLLQGDPVSVVILNCVLCPLSNRLSTLEDLSVLMTFLLFLPHGTHSHLLTLHSVNLVPPPTFALNLSKCQLWNKGNPYDASISKTDNAVLLRAQRIAKLPLPYVVSYRLFTSLVSSCYNHYALSCDMSSSQNASLKHAITSILVVFFGYPRSSSISPSFSQLSTCCWIFVVRQAN